MSAARSGYARRIMSNKQVVAGIRQQRGVQERVVAHRTWQAHPVGARSLGARAAHEVRWFVHAELERRRLLDPAEAVQTLLRGEVTNPLLQERKSFRSSVRMAASRRARALAEPAWNERIATNSCRFPCMTVARRVEMERPSRTRSTSHIDRLAGNPGLDEICMQRVGILADHRRAGGQQCLGDHLATENPVEAVRLSGCSKPIPAHRLECRVPEEGRRGRLRVARASAPSPASGHVVRLRHRDSRVHV